MNNFASVSFALTADGSAYLKTLGNCKQASDRFAVQVQDRFNSVANALNGAFQLAQKTLTGLFTSFASYGDKIAKMAQRTGIAAQSLSELEYVASQSGTSIDTFETAIKKMEQTLAQAANGSSAAQQRLEMLGLSLADLANKTPDQQFRIIASAIASLPDPSQRAAAAINMFGRSGTELIPLMNQGADGIEKLIQKAHDLGLVMSEEDYKAAEDATDALDNFKRSTDALKRTLSAEMVPILTNAANKIAEISGKVIEWAQANPEAVRTMAAIVTGISALVIGLTGATKAVQMFTAALAFTEAHPVIAALTALCAVVSALAVYYNQASDAVNNYNAAVQKTNSANKTRRQKMLGYTERINELNAQETLSDSEKAEMKYMLGELNSEYENLGLTVDETTGKILGMADAMGKIKRAQQVQRSNDIDQTNNTLFITRMNLQNQQKELEEGSPEWISLQKQIEELTKQIDENKRLSAALYKGEVDLPEEGTVRTPVIPAAEAAAEEATENGPTAAQQAAEEMWKGIIHANDTAAEREIDRLSDNYQKILKQRTEEIMKAEGIGEEEAKTKAEAELANLWQDTQKRIEEIRAKAAEEEAKKQAEEDKRKQEEEARKAEQRAGYELSDTDRRRAEFDAQQGDLTSKLNDAIAGGKTSVIRSTLNDLAKLEKDREAFEKQAAADRVKAASEEYKAKKAALEEAKKSGDQDAIDKASKEFKESTEELAAAQSDAANIVQDQKRAIEEAEAARLAQIQAEADEAEENADYAQAAAKSYEAKGTFNAFEAASLGQTTDYSKKIFENGEEQLRYLRQINEGIANQVVSGVFA